MDENKIPRWEVDRRIEVDLSLLHWPSEREFRKWRDGHHANRDFVDVRGAQWSEVRELLDAERRLVAEASLTCSHSGVFMEKLESLAEKSNFRDEFLEIPSFDVGIISTVWAISAAGCAPFTSCAGHRDPPHVDFYAKAGLIPILKEAAEMAETGLVNNSEGRLEVFAESIPRMLRFAESLMELSIRRDDDTQDQGDSSVQSGIS